MIYGNISILERKLKVKLLHDYNSTPNTDTWEFIKETKETLEPHRNFTEKLFLQMRSDTLFLATDRDKNHPMKTFKSFGMSGSSRKERDAHNKGLHYTTSKAKERKKCNLYGHW